jgi:lipopolysaccharide export system protein LptC
LTGIPTTQRDFNPRATHQNISGLKARTRKIDRFKYGLPAIALLILLTLILWPHFQRWHYDTLPRLEDITSVVQKNNTATYPAYKGVDKNNQPYTISAEQGREISADEIELSLPAMEIILKSGSKVTLSASSGTFNKAKNNIHLLGNVVLTHSGGYSLETSQAWLDLEQGKAFTNDPVWGNGPLGTIQAKEFYLDEKNDMISFKGQSQLFIHAEQRKEK